MAVAVAESTRVVHNLLKSCSVLGVRDQLNL